MEKTYSKDWCQGFCTLCGTGCAEHNEEVYQLQKEIKMYSEQSKSYLDTVKALRYEIEDLRARIG
jgi:hypothetical protein